MKKIFLPLLFSFLLFLSNAQAQRNCGSMSHLQQQMQDDPTLASKMNQIEQHTNQFIASNNGHAKAIINIPVVVHVVYNTTTQNISDAQILSQIAVLNQDFAASNSDVSLVPSVFSGLVSNTQIQFCLAQQTPTGVTTTGIVRKSTTTTSFSSNDNVKRTANGGDDAWDATKYLNIWVCNLGGGLLGYAQFPGGAAATDGVVINYTAFGNMGTAAAPYGLGRTATHEVGHWLNLRHIWGDANCGNDQVGDTPTQQTSNYGCPSFPHITCSNGSNGDMFMNYMDYTDDACMYMFTVGQSSRMNALFATGGARVGLLSSMGCMPGGSTPVCSTPSGLGASSITSSSAVISWGAVSSAVGYNVNYKATSSATWTSTSTSSTSLNLTGLTATTSYDFQVQANCGTNNTSAFSGTTSFSTTAVAVGCTDAYEANDALSSAYSVNSGTSYLAKICSSTDVDWYKFSTTTTLKNFRVQLTTLPADYDIEIYNSAGTYVGQSIKAGTTNEKYVKNNAGAGTWYVKVLGYGGVYSTTANYTLKVTTSSSTLARYTNGNKNEITDETEAVDFTIYPNPASSDFTLMYEALTNENAVVTIYDITGKVMNQNEIYQTEGNNKFSLNVSSLNSGLYIVALKNSEGVQTQRLQLIK
ncbi:MAG: hypothetical protein RL065_621 [Bacteroidota bacterium]